MIDYYWQGDKTQLERKNVLEIILPRSPKDNAWTEHTKKRTGRSTMADDAFMVVCEKGKSR